MVVAKSESGQAGTSSVGAESACASLKVTAIRVASSQVIEIGIIFTSGSDVTVVEFREATFIVPKSAIPHR